MITGVWLTTASIWLIYAIIASHAWLTNTSIWLTTAIQCLTYTMVAVRWLTKVNTMCDACKPMANQYKLMDSK
jgi:hypothetical protein